MTRRPQHTPHSNSNFVPKVVAVALCSLFAVACSGAAVGPPSVGNPHAKRIRSLDVTLQVPIGFEEKKEGVWTLDAAGSRHAMLWVERKDTPEAGVESFVEKLAAGVGKRGTAGVIRREKVELDDLEGHYLEAATVIGQQASAAMQLVVGAEDGMYMVSLVATAGAMRKNRKAFEACVKSLRIPSR